MSNVEDAFIAFNDETVFAEQGISDASSIHFSITVGTLIHASVIVENLSRQTSRASVLRVHAFTASISAGETKVILGERNV